MAITAVNLPITDVPIRDLMNERAGIPVFIDNDANVAAFAEFLYGAGRGARELVMLTIGTGIGGGLILDGEVYRGSIGAGAELGHIVIDEQGPRCQGNCPGHGLRRDLRLRHRDRAAKGAAAAEGEPDSALGKALAAGEEIDGQTVTEAALKGGDEVASDVVATAGRHLGVALASFANIFDPDVIVIGGGAAEGRGTCCSTRRARSCEARALPPMNETPVEARRAGRGRRDDRRRGDGAGRARRGG